MDMRVGWVFHQDFLKHHAGPLHPERPERLDAIVSALTGEGLLRMMQPLDFAPAAPADLSGVHDPAYIDLVRMACREGITCVGSKETRICRHTYSAAMLAVGGVLAACEAAMNGGPRRSFCAVRPPGHHAERDYAMGFCIFNNIAVAADILVRKHGLERVAIVDFDVHHGNGTQSAFESRADVLFVSIHQDPATLFPGSGYESETGHGKGRGYTVNVPMPPGSDDAAYRRAFAEKIMPWLYRYQPQFLLVSSGFDAVRDDPISRINLEPDSFAWMTLELVGLAESCCGGRLVSVLEGGYELDSLRRSVVAHVLSLMNEKTGERAHRASASPEADCV